MFVLKRPKATLDVVDASMLVIVPIASANKLTVFAFNRHGQLHSWCTDLNSDGALDDGGWHVVRVDTCAVFNEDTLPAHEHATSAAFLSMVRVLAVNQLSIFL